jgi:hypothetical protein
LELISQDTKEQMKNLLLNNIPQTDIGSSVNLELDLNINGNRYDADFTNQINDDVINSQNNLVHYLNAIR